MKILAIHNDISNNQNQKENMVVFVINVVQYLFLKGLKLVSQDVLIQALVNVQLDVQTLVAKIL